MLTESLTVTLVLFYIMCAVEVPAAETFVEAPV